MLLRNHIAFTTIYRASQKSAQASRASSGKISISCLLKCHAVRAVRQKPASIAHHAPVLLRYVRKVLGNLARFWPGMATAYLRQRKDNQPFLECERKFTGFENPRVGGSIPSLAPKYREPPKEPCVLGVFLLPAILWLLDQGALGVGLKAVQLTFGASPGTE